jgi:hypothetical protein
MTFFIVTAPRRRFAILMRAQARYGTYSSTQPGRRFPEKKNDDPHRSLNYNELECVFFFSLGHVRHHKLRQKGELKLHRFSVAVSSTRAQVVEMRVRNGAVNQASFPGSFQFEMKNGKCAILRASNY